MVGRKTSRSAGDDRSITFSGKASSNILTIRHKLDATLDHYQGTFRCHCLPAHCGHHLNPIEGFWRVMKDAIGAGRCFPELSQLYKRTRQVLMAHHERPIYEFHW